MTKQTRPQIAPRPPNRHEPVEPEELAVPRARRQIHQRARLTGATA
jgi:hypothetical protein